jgi:hypothetical protein
VSKETKELAQSLSEVVKDKAKDVANTASDGIMQAIENMDPKYAKETLGTLFPVLSLPVKLLIVLMSLACVALSGAMAYEMHGLPAQFDVYDVAAICALPLVGILLLCAVPIKSLAYGSAALGAEILHRKIQHSERLRSSGEEVTVKPDTVNAAAADKPADQREQTHSEHR